MTSLRSGAATDTGQVRANNQDAVLIAEPVFAVADGMGGHVAGEIASQVAIESLQEARATSRQELVDAVRSANRAVWQRAAAEPELRGMGTTLCAVALVPAAAEAHDGDTGERIIVANVGDSRVYQFHDGDLDQITDDHSLVEDLVREGRLSPAEARTHPQRNILTRVLGNEPEVEVDSWEIIPHHGDRYVLCSDGLFNEVDDDRIAAVLRRLADPEEAAHELVTLANQGGGRDNVSVVVVDVVDDGAERRAGRAATTAVSTTATNPALSASLAGTSLPTPVPPPAHTTTAVPAVGASSPPADAPPPPPQRSSRRFTWRSLLFVFSLLIVLGGAAAAVVWFARSTYYVGVDDEQVAIFRGRPGGLLWIQPTLAERTPLSFDDVPPARRAAVTSGKEEPSLVEARRYVASLREQAEAERRRTTTTTTSTTITNGDPTAPGAPAAATTTTTSVSGARPG